ncbi:MAG: hypothetical protein AB1773_11015 [Pseudomonadota bacterium]
MELKDIFRYEERRLYPTMMGLRRCYDQLRNRFEEFVRCFPPQAGTLHDVAEFVGEPDKPLLTARFCGKEFRFRFDMAQGGNRGQVRCLVFSPGEPDAKEQELGRFTFNGEGITDIVPPGPNADPLPMNQQIPAYCIAGSFLTAAIEQAQ